MSTFEHRVWAVVGGDAHASAYGPMDWLDVNGDWRATVEVAADNFEEGELRLQMVVRPDRRACEPSVILMHNGTNLRRLDVNGWHREPGQPPRRCTHLQGEPPPNLLEWLEEHPVLSMVVTDSDPDALTLHQAFIAAATLFHVNVAGVDWSDPPEGRP